MGVERLKRKDKGGVNMSKYWKNEMRGRNKDFLEGVAAGIKAYAYWNNGTQYVGNLKRPLSEVIQTILKAFYDVNPSEVNK